MSLRRGLPYETIRLLDWAGGSSVVTSKIVRLAGKKLAHIFAYVSTVTCCFVLLGLPIKDSDGLLLSPWAQKT